MRPDAGSRRTLKSAARLYAVQALFQMEAAEAAVETVREEFDSYRIGVIDPDTGEEQPDADRALFARLIDDAVSWQARIDQATDRALVARWPIDRIDPTLRAVFRAAGAEFLREVTPPKVVINEYVDLAKAFFPEGREARFVNAVLDHMAREMRPEAFEA